MHLMIVITMCCIIISSLNISKIFAEECPDDKEKKWSYQPNYSNGPPHWGDTYPTCNGESQSPINIDTSKLSSAKGQQNLKLTGYETPIKKVKIENNGHTIVITPRDGVKRSLQLDGVKYNLESFHFHWGNQTSKGSEHEINGKKYDMEAHFVHMNDKGEIAVVGNLFKVNHRINPAMDNILREMSRYMHEGEAFEGNIIQLSFNPRRRGNIYLQDLVDEKCSYYRYDGSLTTPPCTENVKWLLCKVNKYVRKSEMNRLFSLYSNKKGSNNNENQCHLINNYRPIQPLNGRKVYA